MGCLSIGSGPADRRGARAIGRGRGPGPFGSSRDTHAVGDFAPAAEPGATPGGGTVAHRTGAQSQCAKRHPGRRKHADSQAEAVCEDPTKEERLRINRRGPSAHSGLCPGPRGGCAPATRSRNLKTFSEKKKNQEAWRPSFAPTFRLILQLENADGIAAAAHPRQDPRAFCPVRW